MTARKHYVQSFPICNPWYCDISNMSAIEAAAKPLNVSPLIKFSRWSLLLLGIVYGTIHQKRFERKEAALREEELRLKPIREAKLAEERKIKEEAERQMILEWQGKK